ncbi:MAG: hypothetical protein AVDCRST_MAG53-3484, partial [uncultured Solirubrobacteraceae bacterium]
AHHPFARRRCRRRDPPPPSGPRDWPQAGDQRPAAGGSCRRASRAGELGPTVGRGRPGPAEGPACVEGTARRRGRRARPTATTV